MVQASVATGQSSKLYCYGVAARDLEEVILRFDRHARARGASVQFSIAPVILRGRAFFTIIIASHADLAEVRESLLKESLIRL